MENLNRNINYQNSSQLRRQLDNQFYIQLHRQLLNLLR